MFLTRVSYFKYCMEVETQSLLIYIRLIQLKKFTILKPPETIIS